MNAKIAIPVTLLAIIGFTAGGYLAGRHSHDLPPDKPTLSEHDEAHQWTCSMHPFIIRDKPGLCPICGMDLVPVKKDAAQNGVSGGGITIDPATSQNMGVRVAPVLRQDISRSIKTVGIVTVDESRQSSVNSKIEGWIERLYVDQTGQSINKGAPLLEIYSPELVAAQQEYLLALQNSQRLAKSPYPEIAEGAGRLKDAARTRLKYWDISDRQIAALEKEGEVKKAMTLYSPGSGVVMMKKALLGMKVMPGEELLQLTDLSRIWVDAELYEYQLPAVKVGDQAEIILPYSVDRTLHGKVSYLYPTLAGETRTARARIELANPSLELKPEMYVDVQIAGAKQTASLVIPSEAILDSGEAKIVFISLGGGHFEPRTVRTGVKDDSGHIEILDGLKEGDQVVVSAQFMLDSESRLREAVQKMTAPQGAAIPAAAPATPEKSPEKAKEKLDDLFK